MVRPVPGNAIGIKMQPKDGKIAILKALSTFS